MKKILKIIMVISLTIGLIVVWCWADDHDYFQTDFRESTTEQIKVLEWQASDSDSDSDKALKERFRSHFTDTAYAFPRQKVSKIKIFRNIPIIGLFTSKSLKQKEISKFIDFCNDSTNFDWGETTWAYYECQYYIRFYNYDNKVVGKIYLLLDKHMSMTEAKPVCPSMKFGELSTVGFEKITRLINDKNNWE